MDDFLKMDIFFGVTTVAVVLITVLLSLVLIRVLRLLSVVERVTLLVEEEGEQIRDDIRNVRAKVKEEGVRVGQMLGLLGSFAKPKPRTRRKKESSS
ncbi:MAG: hypothetical protein AB199_02555 [Parcubacteria bacterium C7867-004]|nr:MAG: hypothetical protein AB199_02555 [Parcubacteria bacterium C7867-004]